MIGRFESVWGDALRKRYGKRDTMNWKHVVFSPTARWILLAVKKPDATPWPKARKAR